jgi:outer membrane protein TolC
MTSKRTLFLAAVAAIFNSVPAWAQAPVSPDSSLRAILLSIEGTRISLQDAIEGGRAHSTGLRQSEASYLAARGSARREAGFYDPNLFFTLNRLNQELPTASFFAGASRLITEQTTSRSGIRMNLPTGTQLELGLNTVSLSTNSSFASLNPEYDVFGSLSIRQPLLGGFLASGRKNLSRAEEDAGAAEARYNQALLSTDVDVERSYWDLYAAGRDFAAQKLTRDRAESFLRETEVRAATGLVGPNQVANARTFLAQQTIQLLDRQEQLDRQSDNFASLIGVRPDPGTTRFTPVDQPQEEYPYSNIDSLIAVALRTNLDLQAAEREVESARVLATAARWEALPSVNLVGSIGGTGLGGVPRQVIFGTDTLPAPAGGSMSDAVRQVSSRDYPNWSVGVEVNIPIGFRSGLGEKDRADAGVLAAEQRYIERSRLLTDDVRATYRELTNGSTRLRAARDGVDAAQEQIRIGLIEFHNGRLTAFELVRLGDDFALAQQQYSSALVRTAKAAAQLRRLTSGNFIIH